jgi:hypothetical protein
MHQYIDATNRLAQIQNTKNREIKLSVLLVHISLPIGATANVPPISRCCEASSTSSIQAEQFPAHCLIISEIHCSLGHRLLNMLYQAEMEICLFQD